jgi:hypothetical protein
MARGLLYLLFPAALVILGLASASQGIIELAPGQVAQDELTLAYEDQELSIQITGPSSNWILDPTTTPNEATGILVVKATVPWQIHVFADPATKGYLTEYDPASTQFVSDGLKLDNPMSVSAESGNNVDLSEGGMLVKGTGSRTVLLTFSQEVTLKDPVLAGGHVYRIILDFACSPDDEV